MMAYIYMPIYIYAYIYICVCVLYIYIYILYIHCIYYMYGTYISLMTMLTSQFWIYGAPTGRHHHHHPGNIAKLRYPVEKIMIWLLPFGNLT
jgi:hypothetical protein